MIQGFFFTRNIFSNYSYQLKVKKFEHLFRLILLKYEKNRKYEKRLQTK